MSHKKITQFFEGDRELLKVVLRCLSKTLHIENRHFYRKAQPNKKQNKRLYSR